jgi:hypothetical protein
VIFLFSSRYFGGGTLQSGAADRDFIVTQPKTSSKHYEDGTINFHGIAGKVALIDCLPVTQIISRLIY